MSYRWTGPEAARVRQEHDEALRRTAWFSFAAGAATAFVGVILIGALGWLPVAVDLAVRLSR